MGWFIALIEIVTVAALGLFGVNVETAEVCIDAPAERQTVEYVEQADAFVLERASFGPEMPAPCPTGTERTLPEAEPVFLIEI